ncbi:MAG TPA: hypothetical protein VNH22_14210 [Blastocatellia bacterium]|jgi:hypothetical protein|nr:hypothetical protein [Blastocatellia bacterium]
MTGFTRHAILKRPAPSSDFEGPGLSHSKRGREKETGLQDRPAAAPTLIDPGRGHDFSRVPVFATGPYRPNDETPPGQPDAQADGPQSKGGAPQADINLGEENNPRSTTPVVDKVELVTDEAGAVGGYAEDLTCSASLNSPGPFNDTWGRGSIANVHQVQFHMARGRSDDLRAVRVVNRTANAFGKPWTKNGNDGPPLHELQYTTDKMVVADAPGWCMPMPENAFPIDYKADFSTYAYDPLTRKIVASISYHVEISKTHFSDRGAFNHAYVTDTKIGAAAVASPVTKKT